MFGNGIGRHSLHGNKGNDSTPGWVGYRLKNISAHNVNSF
jgi:hypothetical protein